ncbi:hypothetical protein TNCV_4644071 [Trichonephila clavipes]|nr:hypothetical protein TNCV_4644071 [Trichonephila clavipes]
MSTGRTELHIFGGGFVTGIRCSYEVLEPLGRLFKCPMSPPLIDRGKYVPNYPQLVEVFLESEDFECM